MAHKYNDFDSAQSECVEHDVVMINVDGKWVEVTEDDSEVRKEQ